MIHLTDNKYFILNQPGWQSKEKRVGRPTFPAALGSNEWPVGRQGDFQQLEAPMQRSLPCSEEALCLVDGFAIRFTK